MADDEPLTVVRRGLLTESFGVRVGKATSAVTGQSGVILVITEDSAHRSYVMPADNARTIAAELVRRANEVDPPG